MKQLNPQTIMAPNFSLGGGRVDSDFGLTFNDSNFSDRILKIEIISDISNAKLDPESFNAIAEWAHNQERKCCARDSLKRQILYQKTGRFQAPYLEDPNTGVQIFESAEIVVYIKATYAL